MLGARSMAVVGASARPDSFGSRMVLEAQRGSARVHLVNPRYDRIGELPCAPSLADLDEPVDVVLLGVPDAGAARAGGDRRGRRGRSAVLFGSAHRADAMDIRFVSNDDYETTNNIHSMAIAFEQIGPRDDVVLIESDLIYEARVMDRLVVSPHRERRLRRSVPARHGRHCRHRSETGLITQVIPPRSSRRDDFSFADKYKTLNIYRFGRRVLPRTSAEAAHLLREDFRQELLLRIDPRHPHLHAAGEVSRAAIIEGEEWAGVDDPNDLVENSGVHLRSAEPRYETLMDGWGGELEHRRRGLRVHPEHVFSDVRRCSRRSGQNLPDLLHNYGSRQAILDEKLAWAIQWSGRARARAGQDLPVLPWLRGSLVPREAGAHPGADIRRILRGSSPTAMSYGDRPGIDWAEIERRLSDAEVISHA